MRLCVADLSPCPACCLTAAGKGPAPTSVALPDGSCVVRRIIPSDNSCLFTAVGYVMEHDRGKAAQLRRVIADAVAADPGKRGRGGALLVGSWYAKGMGSWGIGMAATPNNAAPCALTIEAACLVCLLL